MNDVNVLKHQIQNNRKEKEFMWQDYICLWSYNIRDKKYTSSYGRYGITNITMKHQGGRTAGKTGRGAEKRISP